MWTVTALNRISALATVPLSVFDHRERKVNHYPQRHLAALTDREARADLLAGAHSLWYEYVCLELHRALSDLDAATEAVPPPVLTAITAELEKEVSELRNALAEFSEGTAVPETDDRREWDFGYPFVTYDGGMEVLGTDMREQLDRAEDGVSSEERERAVSNLRVLVTAHAQCSSEQAALDSRPLGIFSEPYDSDGYYLSVHTPEPGKREAATWEVEIGHWEPDDPDDEDCSSATGNSDVRCELPAPPTADGLTRLLDEVEHQPTILAKWASAHVGAILDGTELVVTDSYND